MGGLLDPDEDQSKLSDAAVAAVAAAVADSDNVMFDSTVVAAAAAVSGGDAGKDVGGDVESENYWRGRPTGG